MSAVGGISHICVVEPSRDNELSHREFWIILKLKPQDSYVLGIREVDNTTNIKLTEKVYLKVL